MTQPLTTSDTNGRVRNAGETLGGNPGTNAAITRVAFFGHDIHDAAIRRRSASFAADGFDVVGFMMRRGDLAATEWMNIDLGETRDGAFLNRVGQIFRGARIAAASDALPRADIIYARNLDMLACAFLAKRQLKLDTPVIYECLDVHRLLVRQDPLGMAMRHLEGQLLRRCKALIVSSPAFLREHFVLRYNLSVPNYLVENRMVDGMNYGPRPSDIVGRSSSDPLRIGWFGVLRCSRSLDLLVDLSDRLGSRVDVRLRGRVSRREIPDFEKRIEGRRNITFGGEFKAPEDLASIYSSVDVVWAGDFMEAGFNSVWLLPNRLYEGGYYGVPSVAPAGTETARWIMSKEGGYEVAEPLHDNLPALIQRLLEDRCELERKRKALLNLPVDVFVEPRGEMKMLFDAAIGGLGKTI
ncbi:MAG: glycosyl transferase family 1 [Pseudomonadota bacterium]